MKKFFLLLLIPLLVGCKGRINPNEWVVSTSTCWNTMSVLKAGDVIPRMMTACDRIVILPATELSAEFKTETKFSNRLAGVVELTYQWVITDPIQFVGSAKSIVSTPTSGGNKVDPDKLEAIENAVVDKMLINLIREYTPNVDPQAIDELIIERELKTLSDSSFVDRGIKFDNLSVNVTLSPQAEEALDVISALDFYKANGEEELGRRIIEAKAGATNIRISSLPVGENK